MDLVFLMLVWLLAIEILVYDAIQTANVWIESEYTGGLRWLWARICAWVAVLGLIWCAMIAICFVALALNQLTLEELEDYSGRSFWLVALGAFVRVYYYVVGDAWAAEYRRRVTAQKSTVSGSFIADYNRHHAITSIKPACRKMYDDFFDARNWWWRAIMVVLTLSTLGAAPFMVVMINRFAALEPLPASPATTD